MKYFTFCLLIGSIFVGVRTANSQIMMSSSLNDVSSQSKITVDGNDASSENGAIKTALGPVDIDCFSEAGAFVDGVTDHVQGAASLKSNVPDTIGSSLHAQGDAGVSADINGASDSFEVLARSFFEAFFTVGTGSSFSLAADLHWEGSVPPADGISRVQLFNVTDSTTVAEVLAEFAGPGSGFDTDSIDTAVFLNTGVMYRITGEVTASAAGSSTGDAFGNGFFTLDLTEVPEPGGCVLFAMAACGLLRVGTRFRRGGLRGDDHFCTLRRLTLRFHFF